MKSLKSLIILAAAGLLIFISSCSEDFFTSVNDNPNAPDSVNPASLLSTVEGSLAYSQGGEIARFTSMFTQQTLGAARQAEGWYSYIFTTQDFDASWGNYYAQTMENNYLLIQLANEKGYHQYGGVARILMAYSLQTLVDCWGDVPYSQSFQGINNLHPDYDNAAALYDTIRSLVDVAISEFNQPVTEALVPSFDDFIYGGNSALWIEFGHAIKARLAIHESKNNPAKAQEALDEIVQSFTSNADNAQLFFGTTSTNAGPWNQFNTQRGDISFAASTLAVTLLSLNDPRYPIYIDEAGDVDGLGLAAYFGSPNSPVEFIVYDELKFIEAEAILRNSGDIASAQVAYQEAIEANMEKLGVDAGAIDAYIASQGTLPGNVDDAIKQVASQAWLALYLNPEEWNTWRRTNSPDLIPVDGTAVPRRFNYTQTEYTYNAENTPQSTLYTPLVFWDN